jgi:diadenosine tetraphosphatase ApaH/serine/threonine PP2A family protein phosphatase
VYAIISDIHSNIEALDAVLSDIAAHAVDRIVCLGDVIGYGPNPRECLDVVARCEFVLIGNHEAGLLQVAEDFNDRARRALEWTRGTLNSPAFPKERNYAYWDQIDCFVETKVADGAFFVHGSPRDPVREYVMPADALNRPMMEEIFARYEQHACFAGHTHVPGVFTLNRGFEHQSALPDKVQLREKSFVNIGSVGQPRDGDNRASYVIVDGDVVTFRRVRYDFETTMAKIRRVPELDDFLARRLKIGK